MTVFNSKLDCMRGTKVNAVLIGVDINILGLMLVVAVYQIVSLISDTKLCKMGTNSCEVKEYSETSYASILPGLILQTRGQTNRTKQ